MVQGAGGAAAETVAQRVERVGGKGAPRFRRLLELLRRADGEARDELGPAHAPPYCRCCHCHCCTCCLLLLSC
eukprot:SAG11_NODE_3352_length_2507_cov_1.368771_3_plen_73_part_00